MENIGVHFKNLCTEIENVKSQLEAQESEFETRHKEFQHLETKLEIERKKHLLYKKLYRKAIKEKEAHEEEALKLSEDRKSTVAELKNKVEECIQFNQKMEQNLKHKEVELNDIRALNQHLIVKESKRHDELQDARKVLVSSLNELPSHGVIGLKRNGELDSEPFRNAMKRKFPAKEAEEKGVELCSIWEDCIRNSSWHPFKFTMDGEGYYQEFIDMEDEKLKHLKNEYGEEVLSAVTMALTEMNDSISNDKYSIPELWNFRERRKATVKDGIHHMLKQWKGKWLKEKEKLLARIIELEKRVDVEQATEQNKGGEKDNDELEEALQEKEQVLSDLEALNKALIVTERKSNDELQDARKELINNWNEGTTRSTIRLKRIGELAITPFYTAMKRKFSREEAHEKACELCSLWESYLRDPSWYPFKTVMDKVGNRKEIIDADDEKLKTLREDYPEDAEEIIKVLTMALMELNEHNPSGRYTVSELWNFEENRKATMKEIVLHILNLKQNKRRKSN